MNNLEIWSLKFVSVDRCNLPVFRNWFKRARVFKITDRMHEELKMAMKAIGNLTVGIRKIVRKYKIIQQSTRGSIFLFE